MVMPKPDLANIREARPTLASKLIGELGNQANVYFDGNVVSWSLEGSQQANPTLIKDSTIGVINPGTYTFPTEYVEEVTVLSGTLKARVGDGEVRKLEALDTIVAEAKTDLHVEAVDYPVTYLCEYK